MARGGKRIGAGRKKGPTAKTTATRAQRRAQAAFKADLKAAAGAHTEEALTVLADIMRNVNVTPAARVAACRELLDRGHGRPPQAVDLSGTLNLPTQVIDELQGA